MKAPDKMTFVFDTPFIGVLNLKKEAVEYIRKDALLEWLQQGFDWTKNPVISVQQIIDKINSL